MLSLRIMMYNVQLHCVQCATKFVSFGHFIKLWDFLGLMWLAYILLKTKLSWYNDTMIQWYNDTIIQLYNDTMIQWYNDTMIQWYNDTMIQW